MFIDPKHQHIAFAVRRSGMFLEEYLSTRFPFLRTAPEGVWSSIYRHATPGVQTRTNPHSILLVLSRP